MAGLAAARELADAGRQVVVLEARDRVGGRAHSQDMGGATVDLGASWIHGVEGNPIAELAERFSVPTVASRHHRQHIIDGDDAPISVDDIEQMFDEVLDRASELAQKEPRDLPLSQAIARSIGDADPAQVAFSERILGIIMAADTSSLSAQHWDQDTELEGGDVMFPGGYAQIPRALARGLDIRLESPVSEVTRDGPSVRVRANDESLAAAAVIVTLPLGVLKAGSVRFTPALPEQKLASIDRLGFGLSNKVALVFDEPFWPLHAQHFLVTPRGETDIADFTNLWPLGHPALLAWIAGRAARALEHKTDAELTDMALASLSRVIGRPAPAPRAVAISRWASDPFSLGSYSHIPVGASGEDYDRLAEPISPWLYFAGEACHRTFPATIHGAYLSGQKAARDAMADEAERSPARG